MLDERKETRLIHSVNRIFSIAKERIDSQVLCLSICGLTIFSSVLVALLTTDDEHGYNQLMKFRDLIYDSSDLRAVGVLRPRFSFLGHITLAYIQKKPDHQALSILAEGIKQINLEFSARLFQLNVRAAEFRKFDDMTHYYRREDWPVFYFQPGGIHS